MSEELKPCPWPDCGKDEPTLDSVQNDVGEEIWDVTCPHCERCAGGSDGSRQSAIAAWNALPHTVQAAPSDRERRLEEALLGISKAVALNPFLNQAHAEAVLQAIKDSADAALSAAPGHIAETSKKVAPDKPQYAALSPEPWGGPEGEDE